MKKTAKVKAWKEIKEVIKRAEKDVSRVIIFGSRARGDFEAESDWDILVIVKRELNQKERKELWHKLSRALHKHFPCFSFDLIVKSVGAFEEEKAIANTISNEAYLEGVEV